MIDFFKTVPYNNARIKSMKTAKQSVALSLLMERDQQMKKRRKKAKKRILVVFINLILLAAIASVGYLFFTQANSSLFLKNSTLNGYDVSEKTAEEAMQLFVDAYQSSTLEIRENGSTVLTTSLSDLGCRIDEAKLLANIQDCMKNQRLELLVNLFTSNSSQIEIPITLDDNAFQDIIQVKNLNVKRIPSQDAELIFRDGSYSIQPEVYGNELDDDSLRSLVQTALSSANFSGTSLNLVVDVPASLYKQPSVTKDDPDMNRLMKIYNRYCKASVTYDFGDEKEVVDWDTVQDWLIIDGNDACLDEDKIAAYVSDMANTYDTYYTQRSFTTSSGTTINISDSGYGYEIDQAGEVTQLRDNLNAGLTVEREPLYSHEGFSRNGVDDLNGNYVEVDLTNQFLWFYRNGSLVVSSPVITGKPTPERETATGLFPIAYKASPFNLKNQGTDDSNTWDVEVQYWMPFHDGQGLHDATWQSAFGGDLYLTVGSHGCVNLPLDVAAAIYNQMEANIPILLYK